MLTSKALQELQMWVVSFELGKYLPAFGGKELVMVFFALEQLS